MSTRSEHLASVRVAIANNVRYHRQQQGLGQQALADKVGTYKNTIHLIEKPHSKYNCSLSTLTTIAHALGVPMAELFVSREAPPAMTGVDARRFLKQQREVYQHERR